MHCVVVVCAFSAFAQTAQGEDPNLPRNVFDNDPISSCWVWWRPQNEGRAPDDSWLLIVASLGRIPSPEAQSVLEGELARMLKERTATHVVKTEGREIRLPGPDATIAPRDALLACLAGQRTLTAQKIDALGKHVRDRILIAHSWTSNMTIWRHPM
jgi:hypothetical protein